MSVAKVSEISATSKKSFEDAIVAGPRPSVQDAAAHQRRLGEGTPGGCDEGKIVEYQVNMMVTFVLDD